MVPLVGTGREDNLELDVEDGAYISWQLQTRDGKPMAVGLEHLGRLTGKRLILPPVIAGAFYQVILIANRSQKE